MNQFKTLRWNGWALLALLSAAVIALTLRKSFSAERFITVHVASPQLLSMSTSVTSNGRVIPTDDFQARAAFSGVVDKVFVHVGEAVRPGSPLVTMNDPFAPSRYASAVAALHGAEVGDENIRNRGSQEDRINMQGDLLHAQSDKADAEKQLGVLQSLVKTGAASEGEVENAQHRLNAVTETLNTLRDRMSNRYSNTEVVASHSRVADARASLQTARQVLANAKIVSTIAGTVYSLPVTTSEFVPMGAELMRITDLTNVQVHAYVDEPEIGQLALNEPATVAWAAKPAKLWHGHVSQVPLTVSAMGTRVVGECVIAMDDADGTLLPNTDVTVHIETSKPNRALTIPRAALHVEGSDKFVFRVVAGRLSRTRVQTAIVGVDEVQIVNGLSVNDVVALASTNYEDLTDGLSVRVVP